MKRLILSASLVMLGLTALSPVALAQQASTPDQLSENATIHQLVLHNRNARDKG